MSEMESKIDPCIESTATKYICPFLEYCRTCDVGSGTSDRCLVFPLISYYFELLANSAEATSGNDGYLLCSHQYYIFEEYFDY
jgi:hypothetical protein